MSGDRTTTAEKARLAAGTLIGVYRIEALIGEGGMGVVYRALDTKLERPVAIKFLSAELADAKARRRFQREARTASSLNHPHILTVHDADEFEGRQYLVTELVDGSTLGDWAAKRRTWRQIVDLMTGVADGLAAAHGAGILHRDIKPANVLVGADSYAKLADALSPRFGGNALFYLSSSGGGDGLWRTRTNRPSRSGRGPRARWTPTAVSPDGRQATLVLERDGQQRAHLISADGSQLRPVTAAIDVRGAASWSPDGRS